MSAKASLNVAARVENLAEIRRFVEETIAAMGVDPSLFLKLQLAVDEAATNIIIHGYHGQPGMIEIEIQRKRKNLAICLRDRAAPFDPTRVPPPNLETPLEERELGGLGVYLIRQAMDQVTYRPRPGGGNELTLVKKLEDGK
jgi:serine/threonine-protein kinase RsbW